MKARNKEVERLLFTLGAVSDLSQHVVEGREFSAAARSILYLLLGSVGIPRGALLSCDVAGRLRPLAVKGGGATAFRDVERECADNDAAAICGSARADVATLAQLAGILDARDHRLPRQLRSLLNSSAMTMVMPLVVRGRLVGMMAMGPRVNGAPLSSHEATALETMGRYAAVLLFQHDLMQSLRAALDENVRLCDTLASTYFETVQAFSAAIDAKDVYTRGHSVRVARYSSSLAQHMGLPPKMVAGIRIGAYLHDIGKIVLDRSVLNKPGRLDASEFLEVASHPAVGHDVLSAVKFPWPEVRVVVRWHHERMNGNGYPDRLRGDEIPVPARILAVADAFDAMTSNRPYRNRMPLPMALSELVKAAGDHFDPVMVRGFLEQCRSEIGVEPAKRKGRMRVFASLLDRAGARVTTSVLDSLLEQLRPAVLQPA